MPVVLRERRAGYAQGRDEAVRIGQPAQTGETGEPGAQIVEFPASGAEPQLSEDDLVRLWEGQRFPREALRTRQGHALQVVYRGRRNHAAGPDFTDAIIADEQGRLLKGDVELHVRAGAFAAHGHHLDPRYDRVILHVVFHDDSAGPTLLTCGRHAAIVALAPWVARRAEELRLWLAQPSIWSEPCRSAVACRGWPEVSDLLGRLGRMRFRQKQAAFAAALRREGANQALYEGICRALGYSKNQDAFSQLARILPYERLRQTLDQQGPSSGEALLFGSAGFLPGRDECESARHPYIAELERLWARQRGAQVAREFWQLGGLRPENHPVRRLAGLACLVARHSSLVTALSLIAEGPKLPRLLEAWQVFADGFWTDHHDLSDKASPSTGALIGRGRALELLINVVLPFAAAWGEAHSIERLSKCALDAFLRLPAAGSYGGTRHLEGALRPPKSMRPAEGACRQQGRLYLYKHYCTAGECAVCPLGGEASLRPEAPE